MSDHLEPAAADHVPEEGWVDADVREEFPDLRILTTAVAPTANVRRSPQGMRERLKLMSNRFHGAQALSMRSQAIPHAYRVFFRHIGLDPDATRTPIEAAALERLVHGGFESRGLVPDALLVSLVETGVPVWALDDALVQGPLGLRLTGRGERLGAGDLAGDLPEGRMVVTDAAQPVAVLFGDLAASHVTTSRTRRVRLFSVQVAGVPSIHVEEALWACGSALSAG